MCHLSFINVVCEILKSICDLYKYMLCLSHGKAKEKNEKRKKEGGFPECPASGTRRRKYTKKKRWGLPRVPGHLARGEGYFLKNKGGFPECLGMSTRGRGFPKKNEFLPRVLHSGKRFQEKNGRQHLWC
jgi:hypothetical protein